ncbi:hypothetical protein [Paenibacillus sp. OAS669]|uniref:hypothetical protein n=1 Tax=Paenibacillus sp. OAS669 TaxID=2663821 RepID=UPI00178948FE|nr:hypothetical protein [Paenibacillus sp. OAS669]MBE1442618.1 hypothetical protein [Paenibacillus sp. OAS669]
MNINSIENAIGRQLSDSERSTVGLINRWDQETKENIMTLLLDAWKNGFALGRKSSVGRR